jgi:hypothetical protein
MKTGARKAACFNQTPNTELCFTGESPGGITSWDKRETTQIAG